MISCAWRLSGKGNKLNTVLPFWVYNLKGGGVRVFPSLRRNTASTSSAGFKLRVLKFCGVGGTTGFKLRVLKFCWAPQAAGPYTGSALYHGSLTGLRGAIPDRELRRAFSIASFCDVLCSEGLKA